MGINNHTNNDIEFLIHMGVNIVSPLQDWYLVGISRWENLSLPRKLFGSVVFWAILIQVYEGTYMAYKHKMVSCQDNTILTLALTPNAYDFLYVCGWNIVPTILLPYIAMEIIIIFKMPDHRIYMRGHTLYLVEM